MMSTTFEGQRFSIHKMDGEGVVSIEGKLMMLDGVTPHVSVVVQAIRNRKVITTTLSDGGGKYRFEGLKPGQYKLRCHILGGYVYYQATNDALRAQTPAFAGAGSNAREDVGDSLNVEYGKPLTDIDFRFAPFKKGTWKNFNYLDGLADDRVYAIQSDSDGNLWFGTQNGISRYDGKEFVNFTKEDGLADDSVFSMCSAPDGALWFGTSKGASRYDGREFISFTVDDGLLSNWVWAIYCDPDGTLWFGTTNGLSCGVYPEERRDGKRFTTFPIDNELAYNSINIPAVSYGFAHNIVVYTVTRKRRLMVWDIWWWSFYVHFVHRRLRLTV